MEQRFVKNFINKNRQDRLLFELEKKRMQAIDRFSHNIEDMIKIKKLVWSGEDLSLEKLKQIVGNIKNDDRVYIITSNILYDKNWLSISKALELFLQETSPVVVLFNNDLVLLKEENEFAKSRKFILSNKRS